VTHLSRRRFCTMAGTALAAVATRSAFGFPLGLQPGLQLFTVREEIDRDAASALKKIAAIGYKEIETAGYGSLKTASEFRKALDDSGLRCPSAHLDFDLANLQKTFDEAHTLGCTYATASVPRKLLQGSYASSTGLSAEEQAARARIAQQPTLSAMAPDEVKRLADVLNQVGEAARRSGLFYASHNHSFEFAPMGESTAYDYLLQHTDAALVKFELDCGWATIAGKDPVTYVRRYPGRFRMIHVSDYLPLPTHWNQSSEIPPGTELGKGMVPYSRILPGIAGSGIEHMFVEQAGPFSRVSPMAAAKEDYQYLAGLKT
jgi:sugar phosphate isomerase/epimerase